MLQNKKGFSLIELLLVLVLIGIIVGMTVNFTVHNKYRWSLRDAARELTSVYYQAKQRASRENASVRLDIGANGYTMYWDNAGAWEELKNETFPEKITATATANFKINPSGFILNPDVLNNTILGAQTITMTAPRGSDFDAMTITIYPYGGLRVEKYFK